ncbi:MAG: hypothetical protein KAU29_05535 [Gammaproteobacteria bacterium]|nr:hypothetical protein [Gammaproteobacteria bacterium]
MLKNIDATNMFTLIREIFSISQRMVSGAIILLLFMPSLSYGENLNITLIPSSNSDAYTTTIEYIKTTIKKYSGNSIKTRTIAIEDVYTEKDSLPDTTDLFLPIGQRALQETLKYSKGTPVLSSLISESDFLRIISKETIPNKALNIGAIYIDQPLRRHLLFSRLVVPNANRLGFIVSSGNRKTIRTLNSIVDNDIHHIELLNPGNNIISTLSLVLDDSDVVIALPDPIIFNLRTTRNILLSTYRKRVPIIGFSKSYVKAGALAAIYSTPESIGKQTGEYISHLAKQYSQKIKTEPLERSHAKYFTISVNNNVSRSLGLPALNPDSLRKQLIKADKK